MSCVCNKGDEAVGINYGTTKEPSRDKQEVLRKSGEGKKSLEIKAGGYGRKEDVGRGRETKDLFEQCHKRPNICMLVRRKI